MQPEATSKHRLPPFPLKMQLVPTWKLGRQDTARAWDRLQDNLMTIFLRIPDNSTPSFSYLIPARCKTASWDDNNMKDKKLTDLALVKLFNKGSIEAFEELMSRYESRVYNMALRLCRHPEDAEEVLQDVFTTLYRKLSGFEGKSAFSSWLYRIVVNAAFMKLRKRKQHQALNLEDLNPNYRQACLDRESLNNNRADKISYQGELREHLTRAISRLPNQYRAVFILRDIDGLSNQEVSDTLGLSIAAVKSRLHRSRMMLRKRLHRYYEDFSGNTVTDIELDAVSEDLVAHEG